MDSSMDIDVDEHSNTSSCPHFTAMTQDLSDPTTESLLSKFKLVASWGIKQYTIPSTHPRKRRKVSISPICGTCSRSLHRPYSCLHCDYIGCWSNGHISTHLVDSDHTFSIDARSSTLYCSKCDSFVYHPIIDDIVLGLRLKEEEQHTDAQVGPNRRVPYRAWEPDPASLQGYTVIPCQHRRGLLNLGQTCFLNCVLQSFIHNPLLRNFFLSDKHNHVLCTKGRDCTCCEMDKLFGEIFSGESTPYAPAELLQTTWRTSSDLAGYSQQDAHEFFMSMLNQIHSSSRGSTNISCNCIIHSTFQGYLQSDVKCEKCGNVTTAVDPLLDISLELKGKSGEDNTLAACLRRYTKSEKLGSKEYSCAKCGKASHDASKRLSIQKLPPVLSFQFKRFEHSSLDKSAAQKIVTPVRFPAVLNMAPFTSLYMSHADKENDSNSVAELLLGPSILYEYELFAVINHEGQLNNGHYTNYARYQDQWYRFDDDKVTLSSLGACLNSSAYMCFYVKRHLEYKAVTTPTYVKRREDEALKEKEQEQEKEAARIRQLELEREREREKDKEVEADLLAMI